MRKGPQRARKVVFRWFVGAGTDQLRRYQGGVSSSGLAGLLVQRGCRKGVPAAGACGSEAGAAGVTARGAGLVIGVAFALFGFSGPAASKALRAGVAAAEGP